MWSRAVSACKVHPNRSHLRIDFWMHLVRGPVRRHVRSPPRPNVDSLTDGEAVTRSDSDT